MMSNVYFVLGFLYAAALIVVAGMSMSSLKPMSGIIIIHDQGAV